MQNRKDQRSEKLAMIKRWQDSGLNQKRFCAANDIPYHSFHYWYKVYRSGIEVTGSLLPLNITPAPSRDHITLTGCNGIELRLAITDQSVWLLKQLLLS